VQHADGDNDPVLADGDSPSAPAADSGKSLNRQNYELGISRDYTVRTWFCVKLAHQGGTAVCRSKANQLCSNICCLPVLLTCSHTFQRPQLVALSVCGTMCRFNRDPSSSKPPHAPSWV